MYARKRRSSKGTFEGILVMDLNDADYVAEMMEEERIDEFIPYYLIEKLNPVGLYEDEDFEEAATRGAAEIILEVGVELTDEEREEFREAYWSILEDNWLYDPAGFKAHTFKTFKLLKDGHEVELVVEPLELYDFIKNY